MVYRGKNPVEHAAETIRAAEGRRHDRRIHTLIGVTPPDCQHVVADQLKGFGLHVKPWQVITSSVVAARMVATCGARQARACRCSGARASARGGRPAAALTIVDGSAEDQPVRPPSRAGTRT